MVSARGADTGQAGAAGPNNTRARVPFSCLTVFRTGRHLGHQKYSKGVPNAKTSSDTFLRPTFRYAKTVFSAQKKKSGRPEVLGIFRRGRVSGHQAAKKWLIGATGRPEDRSHRRPPAVLACYSCRRSVRLHEAHVHSPAGAHNGRTRVWSAGGLAGTEPKSALLTSLRRHLDDHGSPPNGGPNRLKT
jgi:hypothetical protein